MRIEPFIFVCIAISVPIVGITLYNAINGPNAKRIVLIDNTGN